MSTNYVRLVADDCTCRPKPPIARASRKVLEDVPIVCGRCGAQFAPDDRTVAGDLEVPDHINPRLAISAALDELRSCGYANSRTVRDIAGRLAEAVGFPAEEPLEPCGACGHEEPPF